MNLFFASIRWGVNPELFQLGPFDLPFPVSVIGLVLGGALAWFGIHQMTAKLPKAKKGEPKPVLPSWKVWGMIGAGVVAGQIVALIIDLPTITTFGPIAPRWYGLLFAGAFVSGYWIGVKMWKDAGRPVEEMEQILTWILLATVIGARLGHVFFYDWEYYSQNLHLIPAVWTGGLASHGAVIGIVTALVLITRKKSDMNFFWLVDRVAIPAAIGGAFIRTGNFFNSEIYGRPTDAPWAVIFTNLRGAEGEVARHPTMLYEALLCVGVFTLLWIIYRRFQYRPPEGALFGVFLVTLFTGRLLLEFTKIPQAEFAMDWTLNVGQWLSVPLILYGCWLLARQVTWKQSVSVST
ncbi:MAG: prolipoprotein diacylglyceryl transferase [Bacteroidota bacterium]